MKAIFGWLGDPFLHLVIIGVVVLAIGSRMAAEARKTEALALDDCGKCGTEHDLSESCPRLLSSQWAVSRGH